MTTPAWNKHPGTLTAYGQCLLRSNAWMHVHRLGSDQRHGANSFRSTIMHVQKKVAALTLNLQQLLLGNQIRSPWKVQTFLLFEGPQPRQLIYLTFSLCMCGWVCVCLCVGGCVCVFRNHVVDREGCVPGNSVLSSIWCERRCWCATVPEWARWTNRWRVRERKLSKKKGTECDTHTQGNKEPQTDRVLMLRKEKIVSQGVLKVLNWVNILVFR